MYAPKKANGTTGIVVMKYQYPRSLIGTSSPMTMVYDSCTAAAKPMNNDAPTSVRMSSAVAATL